MNRSSKRASVLCGAFILALTSGVFPPASGIAQEAPDSCISCHEMLSGRLGSPVEAFAADVRVWRPSSCLRETSEKPILCRGASCVGAALAGGAYLAANHGVCESKNSRLKPLPQGFSPFFISCREP